MDYFKRSRRRYRLTVRVHSFMTVEKFIYVYDGSDLDAVVKDELKWFKNGYESYKVEKD